MTDLRNILRSAARYPRGDLDESVLAERTRRRHRRRATIMASTGAAALAALVGVVGVAAAGGDNHHAGSRVEVSSGTSAPHNMTTVTIATSTVPGSDVSSSDTTTQMVSTPTSAFGTTGTVIAPGPTTSTPSGTATTAHTNTTQPGTTIEPTTTTVPPISGTGVVGSVTAGPTCPVEPPGGCPPKPVADTPVQALNGSGVVVGTDTTNADGNFAITLEPGDYTLHVAITGPFPRCTDVHVTVTAGGPVQHDIGCDTGIR
jgi:hypothetical protein